MTRPMQKLKTSMVQLSYQGKSSLLVEVYNFIQRKSRRTLLSESDSSEDEVMSESPVGQRSVLGEISLNNSSQPVKKKRQLYINDSDTEDDLEVVESSD